MATLYREDLKFHKAPKVKREPSLHDILCTKAEEWLKRQGCKVAFHDVISDPLNQRLALFEAGYFSGYASHYFNRL